MPRAAVGDNSRLSLRIPAVHKALLPRAVTLRHTDLTEFVLAMPWAPLQRSSSNPSVLRLSERGSARVLDVLEHPPEPNARLLAAARALPRRE